MQPLLSIQALRPPPRSGINLLLVGLIVSCLALPVRLQASETMDIAEARHLATMQRAEVRAALARAGAALQRPAIVSGLEDPMISPSLDHYPDEPMMPPEGSEDEGRRYDWSVSLEQRFPLSSLLSDRRRGAQFEAERLQADSDRVRLDVGQEAEKAFIMLFERRQMRALAAEQLLLAKQLVDATSARYSSGGGSQAEVLRAEVEVARMQAQVASLAAEEQAAGVMFNASLARDVESPLPELGSPFTEAPPPPATQVREAALRLRPELQAGQAEIGRSEAEVAAMRSMYYPMAMVRVGRASTMAEGPGTMAMVGLSLPIWTSKLRAGVAEARAMEAMSRADVEAMRTMIEAEALSAREAVLAARAQFLALRDDIVPRARMAYAPALSAYSSGRGSLISVTEAVQVLRLAQADQIMSESTLSLAWARLRRATGEAGEAP